ncbi:hypothetical protein ON010_g2903 [Phytophthora cinnamomi]|nr:hypothetical protein ON010_g2903 [Phytophthora cinnamomi]
MRQPPLETPPSQRPLVLKAVKGVQPTQVNEARSRTNDRNEVRQHSLQQEERNENGAVHLIASTVNSQFHSQQQHVDTAKHATCTIHSPNHIRHGRGRRLAMQLHVRCATTTSVKPKLAQPALIYSRTVIGDFLVPNGVEDEADAVDRIHPQDL